MILILQLDEYGIPLVEVVDIPTPKERKEKKKSKKKKKRKKVKHILTTDEEEMLTPLSPTSTSPRSA